MITPRIWKSPWPPKTTTLKRWHRRTRALFPDLRQLLPPHRSGNVEINHAEMDEVGCLLGWMLHGYRDLPGPYTQLNIDGFGWMHDTLEERLKNERLVHEARGNVLVGGLGLGMILHPILAKPEVTCVHVLENNPEVTRLVLPSLDHVPGREQLTIEDADAARWAPPAGTLYDTIWLDCVAFYALDPRFVGLVERWFNRYRPWLANGGYLGHWAFDEVVYLLQRPRPIVADYVKASDAPIETLLAQAIAESGALQPDGKTLLAQALAAAPAP